MAPALTGRLPPALWIGPGEVTGELALARAWIAERADVLDFAGEPRPEPTVAIDGTCTVVSLARYQWLHLDLGFAG